MERSQTCIELVSSIPPRAVLRPIKSGSGYGLVSFLKSAPLITAGLVLASILGAASAGAQATNPSRVQPRIISRIINGQPVSDGNSAIVQVRQISGANTYLCTGSALTSRAVLTAWHCVGPARNMSVVAGGRLFAVRRIRVHPDAFRDPNTGLVYNDIAVLTLRQSTAVKKLALLASRDVRVGNALTIYGYGKDNFGAVGTLRKGATFADQITSAFITAFFDSQSESNSCNGDSGGPAILTYQDGAGNKRRGIVGITSTGSLESCLLGDHTNYINLQTQTALDFILQQAPGAKLR
jgi:secreted trypsin-like serine protease